MTKNLEDLLNSKTVENILLKFRNNLKLSENFKLAEIKRSHALSPQSYILLFRVNDEGSEKLIRGNASNESSRLNGFKVLQLLFASGFDQGKYRSPENLAYDPDYNLLMYRDIPGKILINELNEGMEEKIRLCAQWLKRLHKEDLDIDLPPYIFEINQDALSKYFPELVNEAERIQKTEMKQLDLGKKILIHGDFQPNNIIIKDNSIWVFDFNDAAFDDPILDVASFVTQLRTMLMRFYNLENYDTLRQIFISEYQKENENKNFDQNLRIYEKLFYLKILASLSASLPEDAKKKEILTTIYEWFNELK